MSLTHSAKVKDTNCRSAPCSSSNGAPSTGKGRDHFVNTIPRTHACYCGPGPRLWVRVENRPHLQQQVPARAELTAADKSLPASPLRASAELSVSARDHISLFWAEWEDLRPGGEHVQQLVWPGIHLYVYAQQSPHAVHGIKPCATWIVARGEQIN